MVFLRLPSAYNKTQNTATKYYGSIRIFLQPLLQFWIFGLAPFSPNFLSSLAYQVPNKTARAKMDQFRCGKLWWKCSAIKSSLNASKQLKWSLQFWRTIFKSSTKNILMPFNCDYLILTIQTKRSYPRQHTCSKMHKNCKFF